MGTIEIISTAIGMTATILCGVWFIVRQAFKSGVNSHRLDDIEKKNETLPCDRHRSDIDLIKSILIEKYPKSSSIFAIKHSPRQLNELGKQLYEEINGKSFLDENKTFFFSKIDEDRPQTALDVEMAANYVCLSSLSDPIFNNIKDYVYNASSINIKDKDGKEVPYKVSLKDICFILSIPLRDLYLNEHKEIL